MFTRDSAIISRNIKTPLTSISRAVDNILQLTYGQLIKSLFANNEQGFAYDPNDLSTMFQDAAGTIPVTAAGQPVGLIRDKSGRNNHAYQSTSASRPILRNTPILGSELLMNGDFATNNFTGWTHPDTAPSVTTVASQQVTMTAAAGFTLARLRQAVSVSAGEYVFSLNVVSITSAPSAAVALGITASGDFTYGMITLNRVGKFEQKITVATGTLGLAFTASSVNSGSIVIDDISVKRVTGYRTDQNYLMFDGSDDYLIVGKDNLKFLHDGTGATGFVGFKPSGAAVYHTILNTGDLGGVTTVGYALAQDDRVGNGNILNMVANGSGTLHVSNVHVTGISANPRVVSFKNQIGTHALGLNGTQVFNSPTETGSPSTALSSNNLWIGRAPAGFSLHGDLYGMLCVNRLTTDSETLAIEKELAKRAGATINV